MDGKHYIGFDFDDLPREQAILNLKKAVNSLRIFQEKGDFRLFLRVSGSGNGYHGKIVGNALEEIPTVNHFLIRKAFGDDTKRVEIDMLREKAGVSYDKLFDSYRKQGKTYHSKKWEEII